MSTLYDSRGGQIRQIRHEMSRGIPEPVMARALADNEWFTREDIEYALRAIVDGMLDDAIAERWLTGYPHTDTGMNVAVIMAGNIPMAGFFDMLCCAVTGCGIFVKHSSKDKALMEWAEAIVAGCTGANVSQLADDSVADAVIASGSDNAASFIRARFDGIAMLLRTHRISAAVIDGTESAQELSLLWQDIFTYFTLGCRNVTHIYLPVGYPPETLIEKIVSGNQPIMHRPWHGSYRQARALKTMNGEPFFDGGYFLLCPGMQSETICQITYSFYGSNDALTAEIAGRNDIQCVVGHGRIPFGHAQRPAPWDYPDGRDVIAFISQAAR